MVAIAPWSKPTKAVQTGSELAWLRELVGMLPREVVNAFEVNMGW